MIKKMKSGCDVEVDGGIDAKNSSVGGRRWSKRSSSWNGNFLVTVKELPQLWSACEPPSHKRG